MVRLSLILGLLATLAHAEGTSPLRQSVDLYNRIVSPTRLVGFMKIGLSPADQVYLNYLRAEIEARPLPRAFLAGNTIYLQGLSEPLRTLDLDSKQFSFGRARLDFNLPQGLKALVGRVQQAPRRSVTWLDWIFPQAMARSNSSPTSSDLAALLALGGLSGQMQCLNGRDAGTVKCNSPFMKSLAELGAVGAFQQGVPPAQVFCSIAARGGAKFNLVGPRQPLLSFVDGDEDELPREKSAQQAAQALLMRCRSPQILSAMNAALSYPTEPSAKTEVAAGTRAPIILDRATLPPLQTSPSRSVYSEPVEIYGARGAAQ